MIVYLVSLYFAPLLAHACNQDHVRELAGPQLVLQAAAQDTGVQGGRKSALCGHDLIFVNFFTCCYCCFPIFRKIFACNVRVYFLVRERAIAFFFFPLFT